MNTFLVYAFVAALFTSVSKSACVPEVPQKLLSDPVLRVHPAILSALQAIEQKLDQLFVNTTRDSLSFAVVSLTEIVTSRTNMSSGSCI